MKKIITLGSLLTLLLTGCTTTKTEQKVKNNTFLSMFSTLTITLTEKNA